MEELGDSISFIDYDPESLKKVPALVERWNEVTKN